MRDERTIKLLAIKGSPHMFRYAEGIEKYITSRRMEVINKNNSRIQNLRSLVKDFGKSELIKDLSYKYLEAVERCSKEIYEKPDSTISLISNLRFLFETCITVRLLVSEEPYKYKVRYSIYKHQLEKANSLIEYAAVDINHLTNLERKEKAIFEQKLNESNYLEVKKEVDSFYEDLDEEISIFLDQAEFNGAGYHQEVIKSNVSLQQKRKDEISKEWDEKKKELLEDHEANLLFNFSNQLSKIESELKDTRNWKKKADDVGLSDMYKFIYDYTSALMHSTSYSILIPNQLDDAEVTMILSLATRLNSDILKKIKIFSGIPNIQVVDIDG